MLLNIHIVIIIDIIIMVMHTCERCLCTFNKKCTFDYHKQRKIPCKIIEQLKENKNERRNN
jgi:hypothetical protein